jgi:hypothetical protein
MKEKLQDLINKYNTKCLETENIILKHANKECWCSTCSEANDIISPLTEIYNDLVDIYNSML